MGASRCPVAMCMVMVMGACEQPLQSFATPSSDRPTPVPILSAPMRLAFAQSYARGIILHLSTSVTPQLVVITDRGDSISPAGRLSFVSRNPEVISVDTSGTMTAVKLGSAWVVASLAPFDQLLRDSVLVNVRCTLELSIEYEPPNAVLRVGESFIPALNLWTCRHLLKIEDSFWWRPYFPTDVVQVDSATGKTTALRPGQAWLIAIGRRGNGYPALPVTVTPD